jgi:hypothetical protein
VTATAANARTASLALTEGSQAAVLGAALRPVRTHGDPRPPSREDGAAAPIGLKALCWSLEAAAVVRRRLQLHDHAASPPGSHSSLTGIGFPVVPFAFHASLDCSSGS